MLRIRIPNDFGRFRSGSGRAKIIQKKSEENSYFFDVPDVLFWGRPSWRPRYITKLKFMTNKIWFFFSCKFFQFLSPKPWIQVRIDLKCWIWNRIETNASPTTLDLEIWKPKLPSNVTKKTMKDWPVAKFQPLHNCTNLNWFLVDTCAVNPY